MSNVERVKRSYDPLKRSIDVVGATILFVVTAPIQILVAGLVRQKLGRPILFRQKRPGRDGVPFTLLKFRTMRTIDSDKGWVTNEDRITPMGQRLRSWSLDELPSLWNILRGDMSLVGPRPLLVEYLPLYNSEQARRHEVRPGLTGLAQVSGRNSLSWEDRFVLDVKYVNERSLLLDLKILVLTILKVVRRDGINSDGSVAGVPFKGVADDGLSTPFRWQADD